MTYYKGFDVLIDAAARLPDDCAVLIGGEGELLEHFRAMVARRGLAGKVQLLGHINDDDLASHFEACDIFCMPSTEPSCISAMDLTIERPSPNPRAARAPRQKRSFLCQPYCNKFYFCGCKNWINGINPVLFLIF